VRWVLVVATRGGWPGAGPPPGGTREVPWRRGRGGDAEAMRARGGEGGAGRHGGGGVGGGGGWERRRASRPKVARDSAEGDGALEAQEAPSWLQTLSGSCLSSPAHGEKGCMRGGSGGGGQGTRRVQRAHRVLRCERAFPHPGIHLLQTPPTFSVAGQLSICAAGFVWKGDKTEMRPLCPFLQ
jgi:hypothetical protein